MRQLAFALMFLLATPALAEGSRDAELSALVEQMSGELVTFAYHKSSKPFNRISKPVMGKIVRIACSKKGSALFEVNFAQEKTRLVEIPTDFKFTIHISINGQAITHQDSDSRIFATTIQKGKKNIKYETHFGVIYKDTEGTGKVRMTFSAVIPGSLAPTEAFVMPITQERLRKVRSICSR